MRGLADSPLFERRDLTVDDLDHLTDDLHYELVDGRLTPLEKVLPVYQSIAARIVSALSKPCPDDHFVSFGQMILLDHRNVRRPDGVAMLIEGASRSPVVSSDVVLVVEVVSSSLKRSGSESKKEDYADVGIPAYWIVDLLADRITLTELVLGADGVYQQGLVTDQVAMIEQPWAVVLDLPAWTRERDELRERARPDR